MSHQIHLYLKTHDVLSMNQYGFRPWRSTSQAINCLLEIIYVYKKLDNSEVGQTIFLDYSKAYDTINHEIVLSKLEHYKFNSQSAQPLKSHHIVRVPYNFNRCPSGFGARSFIVFDFY